MPSNSSRRRDGPDLRHVYHALVDRAALRGGEWLYVSGAGGGVGTAAVDLAKALGAR